VGSNAGSVKIGGNVDGAIILFPDPMGATGNTIVESISLYKKLGRPKKFIAIHCIVTPEYLKLIQSKCPELEVFAVRLDRGLSPTSVLKEEPGLFWDQERGLNDKHYIVPGGGGLGEILNNAEL
jgi:uracil phosphoribosyltransferase